MATGARVVGATVLALVLGLGGYVAADAYDVVPGLVTLEPPAPEAAPFPIAPGAVEVTDVEPALGDLDAEALERSAKLIRAEAAARHGVIPADDEQH